MSHPTYEYSIHCLSNGAEYTDTTLLLTVERGTTFCQRYAITGLTSLAARLAADQKVPLHSIRACFMGDESSGSKGLASLLLSLSQAGVGELTICGSGNLDSSVEAMANIVLGPRRRYPLIRTCEVPRDGQWYKVYEDSYLRVHGKLVGSQDQQRVVWIYTLLKTSKSFAVVLGRPGGSVLQPLPEDVPRPLECIVFPQASSDPCTYSKRLAKKVFMTRTKEGGDFDDGLLIRATRQAKRLASVLPFAFHFRSSLVLSSLSSSSSSDDDDSNDSTDDDSDDSDASSSSEETCLPTKLSSYSKLCFMADGTMRIDNEIRKVRLAKSDVCIAGPVAGIDKSDLKNLEDVWTGKTSIIATKDENEIDLDCEDSDENEIDLDDDENDGDDETKQQQEKEMRVFPSVPHLVVLGTGCATPSALRGSSGYALLTPSADNPPHLGLTAILDCGEGTVTNLYRHLPPSLGPLQEQIANLRFIWISHAHLDHYGGLEDLITTIHKVRSQKSSIEQKKGEINNNKRQRTTNEDTTPVVIAPPKVLQYLDASAIGRSQLKERWYRGVTHRDLETSPFAKELRNHVESSGVHLLRSIQVEHCAYAHAVVLNLVNGFKLCYSGDTRPSNSLIRATANDGISLLLHEATFDDDERGKKEALQKRHSTVLEALDVAKRMNAKASLLSHFSQRYPKSPPGHDHETAAFAVDGMWFPLTNAAVDQLPALSRLVQQALSEETPIEA